MSEWFETREGLFGQAVQRLSRGVADRRAPARHPTMATVNAAGLPEVRTVVLRAFDREAMTLDVHTDLRSTKMDGLAMKPNAAFHVWDAGGHLQMRLATSVAVLSGEQAADHWARVPDPSRQAYGVTPPPGSKIETALDYTKIPDPATFAVLRCRVESLDLLHLGTDHRRAVFERVTDWAGHWVSP